VAFINDDHIEKSRRVVFGKEGLLRCRTGTGFIQSLISGDEDFGIFLRLPFADDRGVGAELGLEVAKAVFAEFRAVGQEKRFAQQTRIRETPQESRRRRAAASRVFPAPVARESSTRGGRPAPRWRMILSRAARIAAS
jgi:hypothetical protein